MTSSWLAINKFILSLFYVVHLCGCSDTITNLAPANQNNKDVAVIVGDTPMILRSIFENVTQNLRHLETVFLHSTRALDDDAKKIIYALEDIISPASAVPESGDVDPIPRAEVDKIQAAIRIFADYIYNVKTQENMLFNNLRAIQNFLRDFERGMEDKHQANRSTVDFVQANSRVFLDNVRKTTRWVEDRIRDSVRNLEDNVQKFVRAVEDVEQTVGKLTNVNWKLNKEVQLGRMQAILYTLQRDYHFTVKVFMHKFESHIMSVNQQVEFGTIALVQSVNPIKCNFVLRLEQQQSSSG